MKKELKDVLVHDKVELISEESSAYLDLSDSLKSGPSSPVLLRLIGRIVAHAEMLKDLMNEQEE